MTYGLGVGVGVRVLAVGDGVAEGATVVVGAGVLVYGTAGVAVCTPSMEKIRSTTCP